MCLRKARVWEKEEGFVEVRWERERCTCAVIVRRSTGAALVVVEEEGGVVGRGGRWKRR